ncbi:hypothetical protein VST7929_01724 [Vibrio stylophorae]|uniref:diguanylate cyclase n=1 Tax=Vibrio stylophorae TaxID=659351 RepID=A0ABM8ZU42_9VIBR|nr:sensor domain-containing diguanylate cyclase [Vibrio stylophorae]CAH0533848.1 hypothetical protein VST7929_01724 [Vibrio stylophorae]
MSDVDLIRLFHERISRQLSEAHSLSTVCEIICRSLSEHLSYRYIGLFIVHENTWSVITEMNEGNIHFYMQPKPFDNNLCVPFHHISPCLRSRKEYRLTLQNTDTRIILPLLRRNRLIGLLVLDVQNQYQFCSKPLRLLTSLLAAELEARNYVYHVSHTQQQTRSAEQALWQSQQEQRILLDQLQALHDISFQLWKCNSLDEMLKYAVEMGKERLMVDRLAIFLLDGDNKMQGTYGTDMQGNLVSEHAFLTEIPDNLMLRTALNKHQYIAIEDNVPLWHDFKKVGTGWNAVISLWDGDTPVGWIAADNLLTGMPLQSYHKQLLKQFASTISQHLIRRRAEEDLLTLNQKLEQRVTERTQALEQVNAELERLSQEDALTSVANRRVFDYTFHNEWHRAMRHHQPLSLLIIDVDHFKRYNDHFGHSAGDRCLRQLAQSIQQCERRAGALFARYGGEEFIYLLPNTEQAEAEVIAKRIMTTVAKLQLPHAPNLNQKIVTVSIGGASIIPNVGMARGELFGQADKALYEAKSQGRSQYYFAGEAIAVS